MPDSGQYGAFIPTTPILDVQQIYGANVNSIEFKEIIVRLYEYLNKSSLLLNQKDTGLYDNLDAFINGQIFFPNPTEANTTGNSNNMRQVYRKTINFGALPNAATKSVAHRLDLNDAVTMTRIYGCATDPGTSFIPLPYASSTLNQNIILNVDMTNVNITTAIDYSAYTTTYVIIEFITS